jgi:two-component system response regulator LytT
MRVAIVEDESLVAKRIERLTRQILASEKPHITVRSTLEDASSFLFEIPIDLLLLDLNLNGRDGFELLKAAVSGAFHTIIISANTDKALEAYEYGVLDFVGKPFNLQRLKKAFARYESVDGSSAFPTKYLAVRKPERLQLIRMSDIAFIKGAGIYTELHLKDGSTELHDKTLTKLADILPANFLRTHKSYIVNLDEVTHFRNLGASRYDLVLNNDVNLPVSRTKYRELKKTLSS